MDRDGRKIRVTNQEVQCENDMVAEMNSGLLEVPVLRQVEALISLLTPVERNWAVQQGRVLLTSVTPLDSDLWYLRNSIAPFVKESGSRQGPELLFVAVLYEATSNPRIGGIRDRLDSLGRYTLDNQTRLQRQEERQKQIARKLAEFVRWMGQKGRLAQTA